MERRLGLRGRTDFAVTVKNGLWQHEMRGIELSGSGLIIDRGQSRGDSTPLYVRLEIRLPERRNRIEAVARPVWAYGTQQAFRFVKVADVDRLDLAEHLDLIQRRGTTLH